MHIFDAHVHIYPDKIAEKASHHVGEFYGIQMAFDGRIATMTESWKKSGVERCLVHSVATTHDQVPKINDFIHASVEASGGMFVGFCTLHPSMSAKEIEAEVDRIISLGLMGVKLHPDCQKFRVDEPAAMQMYEIIDNRVPILIHAGDRRYDYSNQDRIKSAAKRFPRQRIIAAHLGGYSVWEKAVPVLAGTENLWVDESSSLAFITPEQAKEYILAYGEDRVFFGTDYPMWSVSEELERFDRIDLTDSQREKILWENINNFLSLK
ncbi:MAG: amidohydrolase family protein [Ruminiclostridium sp.]|nr:amidohydrolase family protein [Ruminiclostridium sp.]